MKIGEFAKRCNSQISVVRHYDKLKLLSPVYIDKFTGYRYYSESQAAVFSHIRDLKAAGFTLSEIKTILYSHNGENVRQIVERNQARLLQMLQNLRLAAEHTNYTFCRTENLIGAMGGQRESSFTSMESIPM